MRPAISDSLISGQPLYLLNSNANFGAPGLAVPLLVARATHATGNVKLHVTGNPPTTRAFGLVCVQALWPSGRAAAISPWSKARRFIERAAYRHLRVYGYPSTDLVVDKDSSVEERGLYSSPIAPV